jgi:hypothetical protein
MIQDDMEGGKPELGYGTIHFCEDVSWMDGGIPNSDGIEWAEVVDDAEGTSIPFYDTKPSGTVSGIGWFIRTRHYFVTDNFDKFIVETWQDGDIL